MLSHLRHSTDVIEVSTLGQQKYGKEKYLYPSRRADGIPTAYPNVSVTILGTYAWSNPNQFPHPGEGRLIFTEGFVWDKDDPASLHWGGWNQKEYLGQDGQPGSTWR